MQTGGFDLIKPIKLFNAEWTEKDLIKIPGDRDNVQTGDFYSLDHIVGCGRVMCLGMGYNMDNMGAQCHLQVNAGR